VTDAPSVDPGSDREPGQPDRRQRPTPMVSRYLLWGRRRSAGEERYVDRPGPWVLVAFGLLMLLSIADAYFTLRVIAHGGEEANPVMQAALALGSTGFVILKTAVTFAGAAFLCLHKNWPLGRLCLWIALAGYAALTVYHLAVQASLQPLPR
jgi:hypothetical protein